jgi:hypothetical protein
MKFLATYRNEMQQRDVQDQTQIASFKQVVEQQVRGRIIDIQNAQPAWAEFEKALLAEYMLDDASRMTRHALISWIKKKGKNLSVSRVYTVYDGMYDLLSSADLESKGHKVDSYVAFFLYFPLLFFFCVFFLLFSAFFFLAFFPMATHFTTYIRSDLHRKKGE